MARMQIIKTWPGFGNIYNSLNKSIAQVNTWPVGSDRGFIYCFNHQTMMSPWLCQARYWFRLVQSLSRRTKVVDSTTFPMSKLRTDALFIWNTTVNFTNAIHTSLNCTFMSRTTMWGQGSESHNSVSINIHKTNSRRGYSYNVRSHNFLHIPDWNSPCQELYINFVPHSSCSMTNPRRVDSDGPQEWRVAWNVYGIGASRRWQQTRSPSPFSHIRPNISRNVIRNLGLAPVWAVTNIRVTYVAGNFFTR